MVVIVIQGPLLDGFAAHPYTS